MLIGSVVMPVTWPTRSASHDVVKASKYAITRESFALNKYHLYSWITAPLSHSLIASSIKVQPRTGLFAHFFG